MLQCYDGQYICGEFRCDNKYDCSGGEDEDNCGPEIPTIRPENDCLPSERYDCGDGYNSFCMSQRCDGTYQCPNGYDESGCAFIGNSSKGFDKIENDNNEDKKMF